MQKFPNKNGLDRHWGLLSYDDNWWKQESDETNTSIVKKISKA